MRPSVLITVFVRYMLVVLFFPFSALDKVLNFKGAVAQAKTRNPRSGMARRATCREPWVMHPLC